MNRTAYIAGKVSGLPKGEVKEKFNVVASQLSGMGYQVKEPIAISDDSHEWDAAIKKDIRQMLECDEVHMLPDWQESRGAQLERDIALRLGMHVVYH